MPNKLRKAFKLMSNASVPLRFKFYRAHKNPAETGFSKVCLVKAKLQDFSYV